MPAAGTTYDCHGFPDRPVSDLDLLAFFRERAGREVVDEQIAVLGSDRVFAQMQRAHQSHLTALALTPEELHQRAELIESLMLELGVPTLGATDDTRTDVDRVQMLIHVVRGLADRVAEQMLRDEAMRYAEPEYGD